MRGHIDIVRELVSRGVGVDMEDFYGNTPLYTAAIWSRLESVKLLLELGADPKKENKLGKTPADLAQENGHAEVAKYLRDYEYVPVTKGVMTEDLEIIP